MKTQTKCTLAICGLFIIELLPVPFSSVYSLYVVRKRPAWLPDVVDRLYDDKTDKVMMNSGQLIPDGHDPMATRKKCTITLVALFVIDLLIPVVIPTSLYVVRRRPLWFKNLVVRLYSDRMGIISARVNNEPEAKIATPEFLEELNKKFVELERKNLDFAKSLTKGMAMNPAARSSRQRFQRSNSVMG